MEVHLDIHSMMLQNIAEGITSLTNEVERIEKKIIITPAIFRLFWKLKLNKKKEKLMFQQMLYDEYKKEYKL